MIIACVLLWLDHHIQHRGRIQDAMTVGGLLFGLNLALFNFFMPLIFDADLTDLIVRTGVDTLAVTLGALTFRVAKNQ